MAGRVWPSLCKNFFNTRTLTTTLKPEFARGLVRTTFTTPLSLRFGNHVMMVPRSLMVNMGPGFSGAVSAMIRSCHMRGGNACVATHQSSLSTVGRMIMAGSTCSIGARFASTMAMPLPATRLVTFGSSVGKFITPINSRAL